ncbi:MFS transporter [Acinetobacter baumannii]|nr:MFS transporter [Acinetobacter baumannii]MCZ3332905.1 MHS family MFS transporter [Acinetobacter baumannii]MDC4782880.1 MHS family MFS transporter [Acinetobacter baumannii]MDC4875575.1 MHS family MFS transporter [Acinetobacter baumannii]MDC5155865.1 MHS family MFS transporter [Acinetobacter baumannii]MDF9672814.1 MFS transporter [Acinetobacter baumannii]
MNMANSSVDVNKHAKKAAFSSFLGSVVEYYDFFIYGTAAALVFNQIFFSQEDKTTGTLAALLTFGIGYIARPAGALIFGHIGDKYGRKKSLMLVLMLMGLATFGIGILPTYQDIGIFAPLFLVFFRLMQGLSAGGEQVGASLLTMEHAPSGKKAFYTSWLLNGASIGAILASAVFIPLTTFLSEEQLLAWGWRIPFLLSVLMVVITWMIRRTVTESPQFELELKKKEQSKEKEAVPVLSVFKNEFGSFLTVFCCALICSISSLVLIFGLSWATNNQGVDRTLMLMAVSACQFSALFFQPLYGFLADRIGKRVIFVSGCIACALGSFLYLWAITTHSAFLIIFSAILLKGVFYSAPNALWPSLYAEMFSLKNRYTGVGLATQISFIFAGFAPSICYLIINYGGGWIELASFFAALSVVAAISAYLSRFLKKDPNRVIQHLKQV